MTESHNMTIGQPNQRILLSVISFCYSARRNGSHRPSLRIELKRFASRILVALRPFALFSQSCSVRPMRSLLRTLILLSGALALASSLRAQTLHRYPVISASSHGIAFRIWFEQGGQTTLRLALDSTFTGSTRNVSSNVFANSVLQGTLNDLTPSTRYYYRVEGGSGAPISPVFSFKTFPEEGKDAPATILFGSCQQSHAGDSGKTFDVAATLGGDLFVQLGDWGYHDQLIPGDRKSVV